MSVGVVGIKRDFAELNPSNEGSGLNDLKQSVDLQRSKINKGLSEDVIGKQSELIQKIRAFDFEGARILIERGKTPVNSIYRGPSPLQEAMLLSLESPNKEMEEKCWEFCDYLVRNGATDQKEEVVVEEELKLYFLSLAEEKEALKQAGHSPLRYEELKRDLFEIFQKYPYFIELVASVRNEELSFFKMAKKLNLEEAAKEINGILEKRILECSSEQELKVLVEGCPDLMGVTIEGVPIRSYVLEKGYLEVAGLLDQKARGEMDRLIQLPVPPSKSILEILKNFPHLTDMKIKGKSFLEWAFSKKMKDVLDGIPKILEERVLGCNSEESLKELVESCPDWFSIRIGKISLYKYANQKGYFELAGLLSQKAVVELTNMIQNPIPPSKSIADLLRNFPHLTSMRIEEKSFLDWASSKKMNELVAYVSHLIEHQKTQALDSRDENKIIDFFKRHPEEIKKLINRDASFKTLQKYAEEKGFTQVVKFIIEVEDRIFQSLILIENPSEENIIKLLKSHPARMSFNVEDRWEDTATFFDFAVKKGWTKVLSYLLDQKELFSGKEEAETPLICLLIEGHSWGKSTTKDEEMLALIKKVLSHPYFISINDSFSDEEGDPITPLMYFIKEGDLKAVKVCVESLGADVNLSVVMNGTNQSPLDLALSDSMLDDLGIGTSEEDMGAYLKRKGALSGEVSFFSKYEVD